MLATISSIFLTGIVIKIMDDYLDLNIDKLMGEKNMFIKLESGWVPYLLLIFAGACILDSTTAISLFLSSFSLGMMGNLTAKMPSGLYGHQESILVILMGLFFLGKSNMLSSLFIVATIQLWDDFLDYNKDVTYKKNLAFVLGRGECLLISMIFFLAAIYIDWMKAVLSLICMHIIVYIIYLWLRNEPDQEEDLEGSNKCFLKK